MLWLSAAPFNRRLGPGPNSVKTKGTAENKLQKTSTYGFYQTSFRLDPSRFFTPFLIEVGHVYAIRCGFSGDILARLGWLR